jgi:hypothetical protein
LNKKETKNFPDTKHVFEGVRDLRTSRHDSICAGS